MAHLGPILMGNEVKVLNFPALADVYAIEKILIYRLHRSTIFLVSLNATNTIPTTLC